MLYCVPMHLRKCNAYVLEFYVKTPFVKLSIFFSWWLHVQGRYKEKKEKKYLKNVLFHLVIPFCAVRLFSDFQFISYFITNFIYFLSLIVCKSLSKIAHGLNLFYCKSSRMFAKHALIVFPSKSVDDCSSCRFDGLWKSERVFRLTSVEFSALFFLAILSATVVAITKM